MMRLLCILGFLLLTIGCGLHELDDGKPNPTPDEPVTTISPLESFGKSLAKRNDAKQIATRRELAAIVNQLYKSKELTVEQVAAIESKFPKMVSDNTEMTSADSDVLRSLK